MTAWFVYLVVNIIATILCYGTYCWVFHRGKAPREQRYFLLSAALLSAIVPLIHLPISLPASPVVQNITTPSGNQPEAHPAVCHVSLLLTALFIIYIIVVLCKGVCLLRHHRAIRRVLNTLPYRTRHGIRYHYNPDGTQSYAYGKDIMIGTHNLDAEAIRMIERHEESHVNHHHTLDLLIMNILGCLLWANPLIKVYASELRRVDDYIADADAVAHADIQAYAMLLYTQCKHSTRTTAPFTCDFKSNNLVCRITRLYARQQRRPFSLMTLLPIAVLVIALGSCTNTTTNLPQQDTSSVVSNRLSNDDSSALHSSALTIHVSPAASDSERVNPNDAASSHDSTFKLTITSEQPISSATEKTISTLITNIMSTTANFYSDSTKLSH